MHKQMSGDSYYSKERFLLGDHSHPGPVEVLHSRS